MCRVCVCFVQRWRVCVCDTVYKTAAPVQDGHSLEVQEGRGKLCGVWAAVSKVQVGGGRGEMLEIQ